MPDPTIADVRRFYAFTKAGDRIHRTDDYYAEFDRVLAAHDAEVLHGAANTLDAESQAGDGMYAGDCTERLRAMADGRAEVIAQRPGVDAVAMLLADTLYYDTADETTGWDDCSDRRRDEWREVAGRVLAQIAALAPARPSVSAEQVKAATRPVADAISVNECRKDLHSADECPTARAAIRAALAALGIDVREVPGE